MITFLIIYALLGAAAGILAGLLGLGGGIILVPLLTIVFQFQGFPPDILMHMALGTSLASIIFTSFSSARSHSKMGGVKWNIVRNISIGILLGTYIGSYAASSIPAEYLQVFFSIFLFYVTSQMIQGKTPKAARQMPKLLLTNTVGLCIGFISSLVGIGGGTLSVPFMIWHNVPIRQAIGTSAAIGMPIALSGAAGYYMNGLGLTNLPEFSAGFIYLPALCAIVFFSMLTAPFGARLAHNLPVAKIKKFFAIFLIIAASNMLINAMY